jgi:phosphate transport system permease protein
MARRRLREVAFEAAVTAAGFVSAAAVVLILVFLGKEAIGLFLASGGEPGYPARDFFLGRSWFPDSEPASFGLLPLALGSLVVTLGALALAVPLGIGTATFLAEVAPRWLREVLKPAVELLAAIPSVVIGFVGIVVLGPAVKRVFDLPTGLTALTGSLALAIMAVPTIVTIADDALAAVPRSYRDASLALGANRWQTTWRVVLPAAAPSLMAAVILGAGRVLGETMAVLMVTGNAAVMPRSPLVPVRTITATIAAEMGEVMSAGDGSPHYRALFALAAVLYVVTLATNGAASFILERARRRMRGAA